MGLTLSDIETEIARRESSSNSGISDIDAELRRRGVYVSPSPSMAEKVANVGHGALEAAYAPFQIAGEAIRGAGEGEPLKIATAKDPSGFRMPSIIQRLADKYKTSQAPADPFQKAYQGLEGIANLPGGLPQASQAVTGNPDIAANLGGLALSMGLGSAGDPYKGMSIAKKTLFDPKVPASRAFDVNTAEKYGLGDVLTRADKTGGKGASALETGVSGTLTGAGPIQANNEEKIRLVEEARNKIANQFGSKLPPSAAGQEIRGGLTSEFGGADRTARQIYKDIPDVLIPPSNLEKSINDSDFNAIDKRALPIIKDIRSRITGQAPITEETSPALGITKKNETINVPGGVRQGEGGPEYFDPSKRTEEVTYKTQHSVGPTEPSVKGPLTFQKLNDIRNLLSKEIQADTTYNPFSGNQIGSKAEALIPLKKALDADIKEYIASSKTTPYGRMESGEFENKFNRANSFYGQLKELKSNKLVKRLADKDISPSDLPDVIFGSGNIEDINTAKAVLGKDGYSAAKKEFFSRLLESKNIGQEMSKKKYSEEFFKGAFTDKELQALRELDSLNKISKTAESLTGNSSRTATNLSSLATIGGMVDAGRRAFHSPGLALAEAALTLGVPYSLAKAYLATSKGINIPVLTGGLNAARKMIPVATTGASTGTIADDPRIKEQLMMVLDRLRGKR